MFFRNGSLRFSHHDTGDGGKESEKREWLKEEGEGRQGPHKSLCLSVCEEDLIWVAK